jgi:hypothetical protein
MAVCGEFSANDSANGLGCCKAYYFVKNNFNVNYTIKAGKLALNRKFKYAMRIFTKAIPFEIGSIYSNPNQALENAKI